jgi:hypothetical protein
MLAQMRDARLARQEDAGETPGSAAYRGSSTAAEEAPEETRGDPLETVPVEIEAVHALGYTVTFKTTAAKVDPVARWLRSQGYRPYRGWERTPDGRPICPKHGVIMRERDKQGDQWYSHNVGTQDRPIYCKGYPDKSSPGWEVD